MFLFFVDTMAVNSIWRETFLRENVNQSIAHWKLYEGNQGVLLCSSQAVGFLKTSLTPYQAVGTHWRCIRFLSSIPAATPEMHSTVICHSNAFRSPYISSLCLSHAYQLMSLNFIIKCSRQLFVPFRSRVIFNATPMQQWSSLVIALWLH